MNKVPIEMNQEWGPLILNPEGSKNHTPQLIEVQAQTQTQAPVVGEVGLDRGDVMEWDV